MSTVRTRLLAGLGANAYGRLIGSLIQVLSVPVFLLHWGTTLYGEWILLNAIPSYFVMSDIGFGTVAGNEMTMLVAGGHYAEALKVFQSVWVLVTFLSVICMILIGVLIWFIPLNSLLHLHALTETESRQIVLCLSLAILFGMQETLFQAAFRCVGKYAYGTVLKSSIMLVSFLASMTVVMLHGSPLLAAGIITVVNWAGTILMWVLLRRSIHWITFGTSSADFATIRRLASPAFSFMAFPLGNALGIQGTLIVIGHLLGPVGVVTFNTARTVSRSAYQVMQLINNSVWPEMSAAFGKGDLGLAKQLHRKSCQASLFLCIVTISLVAMFGDFVWRVWTMGRLQTDRPLLYILLFQMLIASLWFTSSVVPSSINKHQGVAKAIFLTTLLSLFLTWTLVRIPTIGLRGAAIALVIADGLMAMYVMKRSLLILDDTFNAFAMSMLSSPPWKKLLRTWR